MPVLSGCGQQFGAFLYWTGLYPKPTVKAEFTLTKGPLLILVEDDYNVTQSRGIRDEIAARLAQELIIHKVNNRIIPLERLERVRQQDPDYAKIPADKLGRRVGAEQILWIKIIDYAMGDDQAEDPAEAANMVLTVRVINCHAEQRDDVRLWPTGREPHRLEMSKTLGAVQGMGEERIELELIMDSVDQIAKLFYDHKVVPE
ncbi:MAG: hypothetical protein JSU68_08415 [Phycisphaerales bacterium]|nr:MAG: hypothetical protein JSU68_08415 [Phycisphaerales bacterium]